MTLYEQLATIKFSKNCYISGFRALNIIDLENHTGDWHTSVFWNPESVIKHSQILGKNSPTAPIDTNYYFGSDGLFKADDILNKMGVPVHNIISANHARAIADLIVYSALKGNEPLLLIDYYGFDDFMELNSDKQKVYKLLDKALLKLKDNPAQVVKNWLQGAQAIEYEQ